MKLINTKFIVKSLLIAGTGVILTACKKDDDSSDDTPVTATITLNTPTENDTISYGNPVVVSGIINGSDELHGYAVTYTNTTSGLILYSQIHEDHATSYSISESWTNSVADTSDFTIKIDVAKDHEGNHEIKEVHVVCLPQ